MASFRSPKAQAAHAARQMLAAGDIASHGTARNYEAALRGLAEFAQQEKMPGLQYLDSRYAIEFLEMRAQSVSQKTLDLDRQAIQVLLGEKLPIVKSEIESALKSRAYSDEQVLMIANSQTAKHALATKIAASAGLRAHELLTLRPVHERSRSGHREFRNDRFAGREGVVFTVAGKGGLIREIIIPTDLVKQLELTRLPERKVTYDRGIKYIQRYDLGNGKQWSDSFSKSSSRTLGWSNGGHGVRHGYAQSRMRELQKIGYLYKTALEIVSQEMGHFRPEITEVYLR